MTVVPDYLIWEMLREGVLIIDPLPEFDAISPSSVDLTLGNIFSRPRSPGGKATETVIDTRDGQAVLDALEALSDETKVEAQEPITLRPNEFVLGWTRETITLPNHLCARIEGRSTLARLGLSIHQTAPTVHATFHGPLRLELHNVGPFTLKLYPGEPVCQLIIETLMQPAETALKSIHQDQTAGA